MPPVTVITVRGSWESRHPPERATVRLAVAHEGVERGDVYARTTAGVTALTEVVRGLAGEGGPVDRWTVDRLHTWSDRPWDHQKNRQAELVFHAQARLQAEFRDLDALGPFLDEVAVRAEVAVEDVSWALTEEHGRAHAREARRRAVADAVERARDYAEAAGLGAVEFVALADVGLLGDGAADDGVRLAKATPWGVATVDGGGMGFSPSDIRVTAQVEARFTAT